MKFPILIVLTFFCRTIFAQKSDSLYSMEILKPYFNGFPITSDFENWKNYCSNPNEITIDSFHSPFIVYAHFNNLNNIQQLFDKTELQKANLIIQKMKIKDTITNFIDTVNIFHIRYEFANNTLETNIDKAYDHIYALLKRRFKAKKIDSNINTKIQANCYFFREKKDALPQIKLLKQITPISNVASITITYFNMKNYNVNIKPLPSFGGIWFAKRRF